MKWLSTRRSITKYPPLIRWSGSCGFSRNSTTRSYRSVSMVPYWLGSGTVVNVAARGGSMERDERMEVDVAQAVGVVHHEGVVEQLLDPDDSFGGVGLDPGVDHLDVPRARQPVGELDDPVGQVTRGQDELGEALLGVDPQQVTEDRLTGDLEERFGHHLGQKGRPAFPCHRTR